MSVSAENAELRAMRLSVALYILVFALKLIVHLMTGVMALLGEALHTLGDIFIYAFLLVATVRSRRKPDALHMFGYGRAQNVASLVAATLLISFTSYKLYEEAIPRLFRPQESIYQNLALAIGVIVLSMLIAAVPMIGLFRQKNRGAAAKAQLMAAQRPVGPSRRPGRYAFHPRGLAHRRHDRHHHRGDDHRRGRCRAVP